MGVAELPKKIQFIIYLFFFFTKNPFDRCHGYTQQISILFVLITNILNDTLRIYFYWIGLDSTY